jgi:flavin-dependent dehydrogenase
MTTRIDVAIVGGGTAGCATALGLCRLGHSCLVIERSDQAQERIGETLPPAVRRPLAALGLWDAFLEAGPLPSTAIRAVWGDAEPRDREFIFDPYGCGWHVDRCRFDAMLATQAEAAGTDVRRQARLLDAGVDAQGAWALGVAATDAGREVFHSRFVVDATGRASSFARRQGATRESYDQLMGIVARYRPVDSPRAEAGVMLLEAVESGWWYGAPLPDGGLVVTLMTDRDLRPRTAGVGATRAFELSLMEAGQVAESVRRFALEGPPRPTAAHSACLEPVCGARWLAVGDAAASYDPLCGQGITRALAAGMQAAGAISAHLAGDATALREYQAGVLADFGQYLALRDAYYSRETRWPESPFWRRRHPERQPA